MRDFPINALLSASALPQIASSIKAIFLHLNKIRHSEAYPIPRVILLLEALSKDMNAQVTKVLSQFNLMFIDYKDLEVINTDIKDLFEDNWFASLKAFKDIVRNQAPRRGDRTGASGW